MAITTLLPFAPGEDSGEGIAFAVASRVGRIVPGSLWPGFDPASAPLAIFDGERTYLFRHPTPPRGFESVPGRPETFATAGQHELMRANTSIEIGGVKTATILLSAGDTRSAGELSSLAVHEMFHVFERTRHPKWTANEADLFTYPIDDASQLQLSRLEAEALRRALSAKRDRDAGCWAAAAMELRRRRFAGLGDRGAAYERGTELNEGLARLVESRALGGTSGATILPKEEFSAGEIRSRGYAVGHALAALLDRFAPNWESRFESGVDLSLDLLLTDVLETRPTGRCRFSRAELDESLARARRSIELAQLTREAVRRDFLARAGWRVVIVAGSRPLSVEFFDPLNVENVGPGEILHTRWIKLVSEAGAIEVLDRRTLTEAAGKHPLFQGVRRITVTGIPDEPQVGSKGGSLSIRAKGITADFRGARIVREGQALTVVLEDAR